MPDIGEGVAEAEVTVWHVKPGDTVREDQSLVDVMTDKATVDMTSPVDGVVLSINGEVGAMIPVGAVLVELEVAGSGDGEAEAARTAPPSSPEPAASRADPLPPVAPPVPASGAFVPRDITPGLAPVAAPSTRRRARQAGIDLRNVPATGTAGRITSYDLDAFLAHTPDGGGTAPVAERYARRSGVRDTRIIGLRRRIAEKMQEAKRRIPHIAYVEEVDVTQLEALRLDLNANRRSDQPKLTLLPFLIRALVRVVPDFPQINARYDDDQGVLHAHDAVHVGIATQTPGGLMVPVLRHAEARDLWTLAAELTRLSAAARDGTAQRDELGGSTITITSLGALGGIATTPVINHPEVAILGPNKIVERPVVEGQFITVRKMMNLSSSFDHRIVDGYDAALFIQRLKRSIEHPALIFMD
nr:dihydrolipoamide acetyltransferase family protein [Sphingomonas sp. CROZ-RG-20F-R02-07]